MNNIVLAVIIAAAAALWAHLDYWLPPKVRVSMLMRRRALLLIGIGVVVASAAFALGDVIGGRAQIARSPVRYATRLTGPAAHHHDLADPVAFWRQVLLEAMIGIAVGSALIASSRWRLIVPPRVA